MIEYDEAAPIVGISKIALQKAVSRRRVPHIRLSPRVVRFRESELRAWLDSKRVAVEMTPAQRKRLQKRGWAVGSAKDFLGPKKRGAK